MDKLILIGLIALLSIGCKSRKGNVTHLDSNGLKTVNNKKLVRIDSITAYDLDGNVHTTITRHYVTDSSK